MLSADEIHVHPIVPGGGGGAAGGGGARGASGRGEERTKKLPERSDERATCVAMSRDLLVYGTHAGAVRLFSLSDWAPLAGCELRHAQPLRSLALSPSGTRVAFMDAEQRAFVHSPVDGQTAAVPGCPDGAVLMWDPADWGVLVAAGARELVTYHYSPSSAQGGALVTRVGEASVAQDGALRVEAKGTPLPAGHSPIMCYGGRVVCQLAAGGLTGVWLNSHAPLHAVRSRGLALRCIP